MAPGTVCLMSSLQPLATKPESLGRMVFDAIRDAIVEKQLAPGRQVSEAELARQLGVSKTPVREALLRLQTVGLVEPHARGARVVLPSTELLRSAYEVRATLEAGVARLAATRATPEQRAAIADAARRSWELAEADDIAGFQQWDRQFHARAAEACGNEQLIALVENAATLARVLRDRDAPSHGHAMRCAQFHLEIAAAIERGAAAEAAAAAAEHVEFVHQFVIPAQDGTGDPMAGVAVS